MQNYTILDYSKNMIIQDCIISHLWIIIVGKMSNYHSGKNENSHYDNPQVQNYAIVDYYIPYFSYDNPQVQNFAILDYHIFRVIQKCEILH